MAKVNFRKRFLSINLDSINKDISELPSVIYEYGLKESLVKGKIEDLELQLEEEESIIAAQTRLKYKNIKAMLTETSVRDIVKSNPKVLSIKKEVGNLKKTYRLLKLKLHTLSIKKESLFNISHNLREENKGSRLKKF